MTFDLTSIRKNSKIDKNPFHGGKNVRTLQESNRGGSLSRRDRSNNDASKYI